MSQINTTTEKSARLTVFHERPFKKIAHRGFHPENNVGGNTIESLRMAALNGFDAVECDVRITGFDSNAENEFDRSRQIVILHNNKNDQGVEYANLPYSQCGEPPLFKEFLEVAKSLGIHLYLDIKQISSSIMGWPNSVNGVTDDILNSYLYHIVETVENANMMNSVTFMAPVKAYLTYITSSNWMGRNNCRIGLVMESDISDTVRDNIVTAINNLKSENSTSMIVLNLGLNDLTGALYDYFIAEDFYLEGWAGSGYPDSRIEEFVSAFPKLRGITYDIPVGLVDKLADAVISKLS